MGLALNVPAARDPGAFDLFLRLCLYGVAEAPHAAEHRHRRRGRRFPPVIGWAAVTGSVDLIPLVLFGIVFIWTPPHFWSLALWANDDYRRAGVPMLPVVAGAKETRRQILLYTIILVPLTLVPFFMGFSGLPYGVTAGLLGLVFLERVYRVIDRPAGCAGQQPDQ